MVDMTAIGGMAISLRSAVEITKAMIDVRDANLIQTKAFELTREIIAAQSYALEAMATQSNLLTSKRELEEKISKLETWNTEKGRYQLKNIQTGVTVYALKEGMENGEEPHYLCPTCYNRRQKSILQRETHAMGRAVMQVCHECGTELIEQGQRYESAKPKGRR
jgi:hypothetical protein